LDNYTVYVHIAPNGKSYIGITCQIPKRRWHNGLGYRSQPKFYNAIKKYGWDNFFHGIVLENLSEENACAIECHLIKMFDTVKNGYNQTSGGTVGYHFRHSEKTKQLLREQRLGVPHSLEHRMKHCKQLEINRLNRQRGVYCMETGETFNSIKEAAECYSLNPSHITQCCRGNRKTTGKLHWKYWEVDNGTMGRSGSKQGSVGGSSISSVTRIG
jgi:predicted GIY-YIG superfamily endonuclease